MTGVITWILQIHTKNPDSSTAAGSHPERLSPPSPPGVLPVCQLELQRAGPLSGVHLRHDAAQGVKVAAQVGQRAGHQGAHLTRRDQRGCRVVAEPARPRGTGAETCTWEVSRWHCSVEGHFRMPATATFCDINSDKVDCGKR